MKKLVWLLIGCLGLLPLAAEGMGPVVALLQQQTAQYPITVQFQSDATADNHLVCNPDPCAGATAEIVTFKDQSGHSRDATQASGTARGDRIQAAINGVNAALLGNPAGLDVYNITNLTTGTPFANVPGIWGDDVISLTDTTVSNLGAAIYAGTSGTRAGWSTVAGGFPRLSAKRLDTDGNLTATATRCHFTQGVASFFGWVINPTLGSANATVWIDDCTENLTIPFVTNGFFDTTDSFQNPTYGRVSSSHFIGYGLTATRLGTGVYTATNYAARRAIVQPIFDTPIQKLAVVEDALPLQNRVYSRNGGAGHDKNFALTVTVGGEATVQYRIVDAGDGVTVKVNWTNFCTTGAGGGFPALTCNATVNFPSGTNLIQFKETGQSDLSLVQSVNRVGVGWVVLIAGYSDSRNWWTTAATPYPYAVPATGVNLNPRRFSGGVASGTGYSWFYPAQKIDTHTDPGTGEPPTDPTKVLPASQQWPLNPGVGGNGMAAFGLGIEVNTSGTLINRWPVGVIAVSIGGTFLADWKVGGVAYTTMQYILSRPGSPGTGAGAIDAMIFNIGGSEGIQNPCPISAPSLPNDISRDYDDVLGDFRTLFGNPTLPVFMGLLGGFQQPGATNDCIDNVRGTQQNYIAANAGLNVRQGTVELDFPIFEALSHYSGPNYAHFAYRAAQQIAFYFGTVANSALGPAVSSAAAVTGTDVVTISVTHGTDASTGLVDGTGSSSGTGLSGYALYQGGVQKTITDARLVSGGTKIQLTSTGLNAQPGTGVNAITYTYTNGKDPSTTNPTRGNVNVLNDTVGPPLQPTNGQQPVTVAP